MQAPTKFRAAIVGGAIAFLLIVQWLAAYPKIVETYYSNGLYPVLTLFVSGINSQFDFSLSEFAIYFAIVILAPAFIGRLISRKMSLSRALLNMTVVASVIIVWFYVFWGLNYMRQPLSEKLGLDDVQLQIDAFDSTFVQVIRTTNSLNLSYPVKNVDDINSGIELSYEGVLDSLGLKKISGSKGLKTLVTNWLLNKTTVSGWFSPFFHEVHYNKDLLIFELPFVLAHEKAHQMGFTSEAEANFLAYLVCRNSNKALIQYSGFFSVLGYFLNAVPNMDSRRSIFADQLTEGVKLDLRAVRERWKSHRGAISRISGSGYDLYLKANKVKDGKRSYSGVVNLIVKFEGKNAPTLP